MKSAQSRKSLGKNGVFRIIFFTYSLILVLFVLFFTFFYQDQEWLPYLGQQFEFIGIVLSSVLLWIGVVLFSFLGGYDFLGKFILISFTCIALFLLLFRFTEMDGDMIPKFSPRWANSNQSIKEAVLQSNASDESSSWSFPQFQGPNRNCILTNLPAIASSWNSTPPEIVWNKPIGEGYSGFVIEGEFAYTIAQDIENPDQESIFCLDMMAGNIRWSHGYKARYESGLGGVGPRATPLIFGGKVYFLGATGIFSCVDLESEKIIYQFDLKEKFGASIPEWGFAGSPLAFGDTIIIAPGGGDQAAGLAALAPDTGDVIWQTGNNSVSWSSPTIKQIMGKDYLIHLDAKAVEVREPHSGELVSSISWGKGFPQIPIPIVYNSEELVISSGYGVGASSYSIFAKAPQPSGVYVAEKTWKRRSRLRSKFAPMIIPPINPELIIALNDGVLSGFEAKSGKRLFQGERYGHGQILMISEKDLLIQSEKGALVLVDLSKEEPVEKGSFQVFKSKTWNPPAVVDRYVLMRNHRNMALVRLPVEGE